jgi:hypothetical protein
VQEDTPDESGGLPTEPDLTPEAQAPGAAASGGEDANNAGKQDSPLEPSGPDEDEPPLTDGKPAEEGGGMPEDGLNDSGISDGLSEPGAEPIVSAPPSPSGEADAGTDEASGIS